MKIFIVSLKILLYFYVFMIAYFTWPIFFAIKDERYNPTIFSSRQLIFTNLFLFIFLGVIFKFLKKKYIK
jgi:hypothetical protein